VLLPDTDGDPSLPLDVVFLYTPVDDVSRRIEAPELGSFMVQLDIAIHAASQQRHSTECLFLQVACALLPNGKQIVDIQMQPPHDSLVLSTPLNHAIEQISTPEVIEGPVAFMRQVVLGEGKLPQERGFAPSFARFLPGPGSMLLDDALLQAAGISPPSKSLWSRLVGMFWGEGAPNRTVPRQDIVQALAKQLGVPVIAPNGRMRIG
jgi:hypothetical protein